MVAPENSAHLFISYASADLARALPLADSLIADGWRVWIDRTGIPGGVSYGPEIVAAIKECAALLLLCSGPAFSSRNVRQEIQLAWKHERPIIPLRLDPVTVPDELEYWLEGRQWIDAFDRGPAEWLEDIRRALQQGEEPPSPPAGTSSAVSGTGAVRIPTPLTDLIGREREIAEISALFPTSRLVTLTGPGGVGKSRLAIEVAHTAEKSFTGGAWFVDLAAVDSPGAVLPAIGRAIGARDAAGTEPLERVLTTLPRNALILVDSFEHVIAAGRDVAGLLAGDPSLTILVTSRSSLGVRGEKVYRIDPLPVTARNALAAPAVLLFAERARAVNGEFALTSENAPVVAQVCAELDGLPLAIELAAARSLLFSPEQLLDRLRRQLPTLTSGAADLPDRQRTLQVAIAWSHDLLGPSEQRAFRRLAVFQNGWTVEAALAVAEDSETDVLGSLDGLLRQSLIMRDGAGAESRFRMLGTIRSFALGELEASGEMESMSTRHAAWALNWVAKENEETSDVRRERLIRQVSVEHSNLVRAMEWFESNQQGDELMLLVARISPYLYLLGRLREARAWCERALAASGTSPSLRAEVLIELGHHAHDLGDESTAILALAEATSIASDLGDELALANGTYTLGIIAEDSGNHARAAQHLRVASRAFSQAGDARNHAVVEFHLGIQAYAQGAVAEALNIWHSVARERTAAGDHVVPSWCDAYVALAKLDHGDTAAAAHLLAGLVERRGESSHSHSDDRTLALAAVYASLTGELEQGARWLGAVDSLQTREGFHFGSPETRTFDAARSRLRDALGPEIYDTVCEEGRRLPIDLAFQGVSDLLSSRGVGAPVNSSPASPLSGSAAS